MKRLFVIIMPIGRENINMDFCFENAINKSMLLCDFTAPSTLGLSFQMMTLYWLINYEYTCRVLQHFQNSFQVVSRHAQSW